MFKSDLLPEKYLNLHIQKYQMSLFAQFRTGILPLHVETCRFRNLPLEQRLCVSCDKSEVGDEYHFLCKCAVYRGLRRKLYSTTIDLYPEFEDMDDLEKFVSLIVIFKNMWLSLSQAQFADDARCCSIKETWSSHVH